MQCKKFAPKIEIILFLTILGGLPPLSHADGGCRETTSFLDSRLPHFSEPNLENIRQAAVSMNVLDTMHKAHAEGRDATSTVQSALDQARVNDSAAKSAVATASGSDAFGTTDDQFLQSLKNGTLDTNNCGDVRNAAVCAAIANKITAVAVRGLAAEMQCFIRAGIGPFAGPSNDSEKSGTPSATSGSKAMFQSEMGGESSSGKAEMSEFSNQAGNSGAVPESEATQREEQMRHELAASRGAYEQQAIAQRQAEAARARTVETHQDSSDDSESDTSAADILGGIIDIGAAVVGSGILNSGGHHGGSNRPAASSESPSSDGSNSGYCEAPPCH